MGSLKISDDKKKKSYAEKTVHTACFYLVELQKNFKSVSQRGGC